MRLFSLPFSVTALLLLTTMAASEVTSHRKSEALARPLDTITVQAPGWQAVENPELSERMLSQLRPSSYLSRTYRSSTLEADLFIAFYEQQRSGESMHSPKHCLPGAGWEIWDYGTAAIPVAGQSFTVNKYSVSREGQRMLVLYWYQSKGRIIASEYMGKLLLARDALLHNSTSGSIVRISVPDRPGALEQAISLASAIIPQLRRCFGATTTPV
jgi:EpsI family protein